MISVVIPAYNHAHTISACLKSIFAQTLKPSEIVIVDDGSTDNLDQVLRQTNNSAADIRIEVLKQKNLGAAAARNNGFKKTSGDYVIFCDADTVAKPNMLEKMLVALNNNPAASYAYCKFKFGWKIIRSQQFEPEALKKINYIDTTSLIRRIDFPAFDENLKRFQDWDLWLTLLEKNKTGIFIPEVLYKKIVGARQGISSWLPSFVYKLPFKSGRVEKYNQAREIVLRKHKLI